MNRLPIKVRLVAYALLALICFSAVLSFAILWDLPSVSTLQRYRPPVASEIFSDEYVKIGEFYRERRIFVPLHQIPPLLIKGFLAAEDDQFFRHKGISWTGILRAMFKNLLAGEVKQGGSTITQQVAKEILLRSRERSFLRKARDVVLAFKMEKYLSKEQILEIYLNQVFLGHHSYGVQAASQTFFNKDVADLSVGEMAMISGLTKAPSSDNPHTSFERAKKRQAYVLKRMTEEGFISEEDQKAALGETLAIQEQSNVNLQYSPYFVEHVRRYLVEKYGDEMVLEGGLQIYTTLDASAAKPAQEAVREGVEEVDRHQGYRGPLQNLVKAEWPPLLKKLEEENKSPLDPKKKYKALVTEIRDKEGLAFVTLGSQKGAIPIEEMSWARKPNGEKLWSSNLIERPSQALKQGDVVLVRTVKDPSTHKKTFPKDLLPLALCQEPIAQSALIAIDPRNGGIRAMVGGYDFEKSEFNRATQARRQPGSAFKPIIYAAAIDHAYTAASMIIDAPIVYDDPTTDVRWRPKNFSGKFHGETIFRDCLIESRNVPTIKIAQELGIDTVISYAQRMGITSPLARDFSLALGSSGVFPLELVKAYTVFAAGGKKVEPISIKKIVDRDGNVLERNVLEDPALDITEQAAVAEQRWLSSGLHQKAITIGKDPKAELPPEYAISPQTSYVMTHLLKEVIHFGTGRRAQALARPAAGKTGTTNENNDAWFIGFTPSLAAGVWVGFDEVGTLGVQEEGGRIASPIWLAFMQEAMKGEPVLDFKVPDGILFAQIDPETGKLASGKTKGAVFEAFREGTEPKETTEEAKTRKSPQQFFLQE